MSIDLYLQQFAFTNKPFSLVPDPDFLFWSKSHSRAYAVLEYGLLSQAALTVVTGEVGVGKTTLIQALLRREELNVTLGLISNAQGDRGDLLRWVLNALDVPLPEQTDYVSLFQHFQNFVIQEYAAGRHVVLIIDEAQNLGEEMLEELRMLTNMNSGTDVLLQLVLVGQPELRDLIRRPSLRQFAQRVSATFHIDPFGLEDTQDYIRHRLQLVGGTGDEFSTAAIQAIFDMSDGTPRVINKVCDLSLVYASTSDSRSVELEHVREVMADGLVLTTYKPPLYLTNRVDQVDPRTKAAE